MNWLKIEVTTPDKPEILGAASRCNITQAEAFVAFFRTWSYFDAHTATGFVNGITTKDIDAIARVSGFGEAMIHVGWLSQDRLGICISDWDRHNGQSAKKRALTQRRNQRMRAKAKHA